MDTADADSSPSLDHAAWRTGLGALAGYTIILLVMTAILFVIPYLVFANFG